MHIAADAASAAAAAVMFLKQIGLTVLPFNSRHNKLFNIPFRAPATAIPQRRVP